MLCIIPVEGLFQETTLQDHLKIKCPYCIMDYTYPDKTKAREIYKLHPTLIHELYYYIKNLELHSKNVLLIKQEETKQIEYIEKTKQMQEKTKQMQEETTQLKLQLEILKLKLKNNITL